MAQPVIKRVIQTNTWPWFSRHCKFMWMTKWAPWKKWLKTNSIIIKSRRQSNIITFHSWKTGCKKLFQARHFEEALDNPLFSRPAKRTGRTRKSRCCFGRWRNKTKPAFKKRQTGVGENFSRPWIIMGPASFNNQGSLQSHISAPGTHICRKAFTQSTIAECTWFIDAMEVKRWTECGNRRCHNNKKQTKKMLQANRLQEMETTKTQHKKQRTVLQKWSAIGGGSFKSFLSFCFSPAGGAVYSKRALGR